MSSSARGPCEMPASEHMEMQMGNALARRFCIINHHAIAALGDVHLISDFGCRIQQVSQQRHIQL